ncbi:MAG: hypothetical protein R3F44_15380 [Candidatus Competibacteraceae bacterium]
MDEVVAIFTRVWTDITSGAHAPLSFRLIIQPLIAVFFAIRSGMQDGGPAGRCSFGLSSERSGTPAGTPARRLETCWKSLHCGVVIVDVIYQIIVRHWVYPSEALMVAAILSVLPYLVMRGLVNRILRHGHGGKGAI